MRDLSHEMAVASEAARVAGAIQRQLYERLDSIELKTEKDVVTEADPRSEAAILETITRAFPEDGFLAEESGASGKRGVEAHRLWVIDPLDGTINYANGIPFFAVSIGLVIEGVPVLGVVHDPMRNEFFTAASGIGAYLDGNPIRCADKERMVDTVVYLEESPNEGLGRAMHYRRRTRVVRAMGSTALGIAYLANGRFDAFVQDQGLSTWDVCAAGVIAIEAGALLTSPLGGAWFDIDMPYESIGIVGASPRLHQAFLMLLSG
jgi:myo-inositol-1(or 4)-monophosphatase